MVTTKSLFFRSITSLFFISAFSCMAMEPQGDNNNQNKEDAELKRKHENERIAAATPTYQSTYAAPLFGSNADQAQSELFKEQAKIYALQANSLNNSNYYTIAKDGTMIIAQLIAPAVSTAITPPLVELRQNYIYKTDAEKHLEKTKAAFDKATTKETESRELAHLVSGLVQTQSQLNVQQALVLAAQLHLNALKDLEKRQKETSAL